MKLFLTLCLFSFLVSGCGQEESEEQQVSQRDLLIGLKELARQTSDDSPSVRRMAKNNEGAEDWRLAEYFRLEKEAVSSDATFAEVIYVGQISKSFTLNYNRYECSMFLASSATDEVTLTLLGTAISICGTVESATKDLILARLFDHLKVDHDLEVHRAIFEAIRMNEYKGDLTAYMRFLKPESKLKFEVLSILYSMEGLPEVCCEEVLKLQDNSEDLVSDMAKLIAYKKCGGNDGEEESDR